MRLKPLVLVYVTVLTVFILSNVATADIFYPESYVNERVETEYLPNGTLISVDRRGSIEVLTTDILKDVTLELDSNESTNLLSTEAYRPALSSPDEKPTKLYLHTEDSEKDLNYDISPEKTPELEVKIKHENERGGEEIHSGENMYDFEVIIESTEDMEDAEFVFRVPTSTGPQGQDSFNLKDHGCTGDYNYCRRVSKEGHGDYHEAVEWSGNLYEREPVMISFKGTTEPGVNFNPDIPLDMEMGEYRATHVDESTFTGIIFEDRYSRASARNGIDMSKFGDEWEIEGFLMNRAEGIMYKVNGWELYRVGEEEEPLINSTAEEEIGPGETLYTDTYLSHEDEKQYYFATFDWHIIWGDSIYTGSVDSEIRMPVLYVIESDLQKDLTILDNDQDGRRLRVKDKITNMGHEEISSNEIEIFSVIPNESVDGERTFWNVEDVYVTYRNYTDGEVQSHDITDDTEITVEEPGSNSYGYIEVSGDLENKTVDQFETNEEIILEYTISSGRKGNDLNYSFSSNSTLWTASGTPDSQTTTENITIPGVDEPDPDPPEPAPPPVQPTLDLDNVESTASVITGNLVKVERSDRIKDTGTRGMRNTDLGVLLPDGGELETPSIEIHYLKEDEWTELQPDDYSVKEVGERTIDGEGHTLYHIKIMEDKEHGLVLHDGDMINITYNARARFGRNDIVTRVSYYDYYKDSFMDDDLVTPIRVGWEAEPMSIRRGLWNQDRGLVNEPVRWSREISINNPNNESMKRTLNIYLPDEAFSCNVEGESLEVQKRMGREFVNWEVEMGALERKTFTFEAYTPPVVLEEEDISIIESNKTMAKFLFNKTFRNYAVHEYEEIEYLISIGPEKILETTIDGNKIDYYSVYEGTKLQLGSFEPEEEKTVTTVYKELPPVLIVSTDRYNYREGEESEITILAVGEEGFRGGHLELTIKGPKPGSSEVYSEVIWMKNLTMEINRNINLGNFPEGDYDVRVAFRRNFHTILTDYTSFHVEGRDKIFTIGSLYILIFLLFLVVLTTKRIYRKKEEYQRRIEELRKRVKKKI